MTPVPDAAGRWRRIPPSPHFEPISLRDVYNARRSDLAPELAPPDRFGACHGLEVIRGVPFDFGSADGPDVVILDGSPVSIELHDREAGYLVFVHAVEDRTTNYLTGFADDTIDGLELGDHVSDYTIEYTDGKESVVPVLRRFAIQQSRSGWGSAPFAAVAAGDDEVFPSGDESALLGQPMLTDADLVESPGSPLRDVVAELYGWAHETRIRSAYTRGMLNGGGSLWLYALAVPDPSRPIRAVTCAPRDERSTLYALTATALTGHPLRARMRQKLRVQVPDGFSLNDVDEMEEVAVDLGTVISARAALEYDHTDWNTATPVVEATRSTHEVVVEYHAHPSARLYVGDDVYDLDDRIAEASRGAVVTIPPAHRPVKLRFVDPGTSNKAAVRLHLHGSAGEYLAPRGHHRHVNESWGHDRAGEFLNMENQYAYVDGECVVDLPLGTVFIEAVRGYEHLPIRTSFEVTQDTNELVFEHEKSLRWRERGWVSADTHVHFLSPHTARLEGEAEGVNVTNILASQWGEMFSNVGDFDGRTTLGASTVDGTGEYLVRVGTENRMQVLGHIGLLGYSGPMIHPLCTGGPDESAAGDPLEVSMAQWAQQCIDQGGLVVMPHAPFPQLERAADLILGLVHAVEMGDAMNPLHLDPDHPLNLHVSPYGLADWYRYLNLGLQVPLVGGSDKMSASHLLGGIRCYAQLGARALTYENWMAAVKEGNTFVTIGPLTTLQVEGVSPGGQIDLPSGGGTLHVEWQVESARLPIDRVEVVVGGHAAADTGVGGALASEGAATVSVSEPTWIALRVRGSYRGLDEVAAHTSAVQVRVGGEQPFSPVDSVSVLEQIQGAIAYVDTIATRPEARRYHAMRASLEAGYNRLHQRMHAAGVFHEHTLHNPSAPQEH